MFDRPGLASAPSIAGGPEASCTTSTWPKVMPGPVLRSFGRVMPWCQDQLPAPWRGDYLPACRAVGVRHGARGWLGVGLLSTRAGGEPECHEQDAVGGDPSGDQAGAGEAVHERGRCGVGEAVSGARPVPHG